MSVKNEYAEPIMARKNVPFLALKVFLGLRTSPLDEAINFFLFFVGFIIAYGGVGTLELEPSIWPGMALALVGILIAGYRPLVMHFITKK
jgi:hypothetical protein